MKRMHDNILPVIEIDVSELPKYDGIATFTIPYGKSAIYDLISFDTEQEWRIEFPKNKDSVLDCDPATGIPISSIEQYATEEYGHCYVNLGPGTYEADGELLLIVIGNYARLIAYHAL